MPIRVILQSNYSYLEEDIFYIVTHTDVLCRQTIRMSLVNLLVTPHVVFKRGVPIGKEFEYKLVECFDQEQDEAGDTLIHTFIFNDWPAGQQRFYFFASTQGAAPTLTSSPILSESR